MDENKKTEVKKLDKVVTSKVTVKKKSGISKFVDDFIATDFDNLKSYLVDEILIPSAKRTISDMVSNGIEMLFGIERGSRRDPRGTAVKVSYRDYYDKPIGRRETRREERTRGFDIDNIFFDNRADALAVLDRMDDIIGRYDFARVSDLYELADLPAPPFTASKYGWSSLGTADVIRTYDGYKLKLPRPIPID